jgi:hypothetical protein
MAQLLAREVPPGARFLKREPAVQCREQFLARGAHCVPRSLARALRSTKSYGETTVGGLLASTLWRSSSSSSIIATHRMALNRDSREGSERSFSMWPAQGSPRSE